MSINAFGKLPFQEFIETDSSHIEIMRNSEYRCYIETYKNKDLIWKSYSYIDDTTKLHTEGWQTKSGKYLGTWREYSRQGELMYEWNHDTGICEVNKSLYPYHDLLEQMKLKADSLIISTYSKEFFDNHVKFEYDCYAYHGYYVNDDDEAYWNCVSVGSWTEPMKSKPNTFLFRYSVKLANSEWYSEMIGMELDSLGNYIPSLDNCNNNGFEKVVGENKTFQLDKINALEIARNHGLNVTDSAHICEFLTWEYFYKAEFYDGQFRYYITEQTDEIKDLKNEDNSSVVFKFNVYSFSPWTGEFIEKKKMKTIHQWHKYSGHSTGLLPDDD
jgi:hypothetical protein